MCRDAGDATATTHTYVCVYIYIIVVIIIIIIVIIHIIVIVIQAQGYRRCSVWKPVSRFRCLDTGVEIQVKAPTKPTHTTSYNYNVDIYLVFRFLGGGWPGRCQRNVTLCRDRACRMRKNCGNMQIGFTFSRPSAEIVRVECSNVR